MAKIEIPETNTVGNVIAGVAGAFLVDNIAMGGAVTKVLPAELVALVGFVVFVGVGYFVYKLVKKNN
jgi:hypothetical protein